MVTAAANDTYVSRSCGVDAIESGDHLLARLSGARVWDPSGRLPGIEFGDATIELDMKGEDLQDASYFRPQFPDCTHCSRRAGGLSRSLGTGRKRGGRRQTRERTPSVDRPVEAQSVRRPELST